MMFSFATVLAVGVSGVVTPDKPVIPDKPDIPDIPDI